MRDDMDKLLVERPRYRFGGIRYPRGQLKMQYEKMGELDCVRRESMGGRYREKWFNENLRPLERFLRSNVGRPWNKVYSEMARHLKPNSTVQRHVFVHLWQMVARRVEERDGELWHLGEWGPRRIGEHRWRGQFYVCPRSGLLREYSDKQAKKKQKKEKK